MAQPKIRLPLDLDPDTYQKISEAAELKKISKKQIIIEALKIAKIISK